MHTTATIASATAEATVYINSLDAARSALNVYLTAAARAARALAAYRTATEEEDDATADSADATTYNGRRCGVGYQPAAAAAQARRLAAHAAYRAARDDADHALGAKNRTAGILAVVARHTAETYNHA